MTGRDTLLLRRPLLGALLTGAIARGIAATVGLGFHARDDYFHVLAPALHWLDDPAFAWDESDTPGAGIRSHLVPRIIWLLLRALRALHIESPETALRGIYLVVGAYSLAVIPALYLAAKRLLGKKEAAVAAYLGALHAAMPYAGTRLLIEAMAMPPMAMGLFLLTFRDRRHLFAGGLAIGLACWLRYQVGAAALGFVVAIFLRGKNDGGSARGARDVLWLGAGGGVAMGMQGLFDVWTTGTFLGPTLRNIAYNLVPPANLTKMNPCAYVGMFLLLTLPPATIVVLPALVRAARRLPLVTWPFVFFVGLHTFVPHKEERFMLPALPLFLLGLAAVGPTLRDASGKWWDKLKQAWPATRAFLLAVHGLALILAVTNQSQRNLRDAMGALRRDAAAVGIVSMGPEMQDYFLRRPQLPQQQTGHPNYTWLEKTIRTMDRDGPAPNRFLGFASEGDTIEAMLITAGYICAEPRTFDGWWLDRWIYALNPKHNRRRSPIFIWDCHTATRETPAWWPQRNAAEKLAVQRSFDKNILVCTLLFASCSVCQNRLSAALAPSLWGGDRNAAPATDTRVPYQPHRVRVHRMYAERRSHHRAILG